MFWVFCARQRVSPFLRSLTGSGDPLLLSSVAGVVAGVVERGGASVERGGARAESLLLLTRRGVSGGGDRKITES